ncbi:MAG TPA: hypothetical protein VIJ47_11375 [Acidimicrobiales bacterium]
MPQHAIDDEISCVYPATGETQDRAPVIGERFARALADKDAAGLKALLASDVDFRAMTPGKFWEADDVDVIVDETMLGTWFDSQRRIVEVLAVETDRVGSLDRVGYRFLVERSDGEFVIEQQVYFATSEGRISWLRLMCSGFLPAA